MSPIECFKEKSILTISLNRPQVRNALNIEMMQKLTKAFEDHAHHNDLSAIVLKGNGKSFCAGGDISWIKNTASSPQDTENIKILYKLLHTIYKCPHPVLCRIHGHAMGGGVGLSAVCDIASATNQTLFAFSEVRLGIIPAIISPFVCRKVKPSSALEVMLTGETFDAKTALAKGLLNFTGSLDEVDHYIKEKCHKLSSVGRQAVRHTKALIRRYEGDISNEFVSYAMTSFKQCCSSQEGQEGLSAFIEKRRPSWTQ